MSNFFRHNGSVHAGNMAYLSMLALFPFVVLLISLSGFIGQTGAGSLALQNLFNILPPEVADTLKAPVNMAVKGARADLLTLGGIMAIWTSSSCLEAARVSVIRAYDGWDYAHPIWQRRLQSMGGVLGAAIFIPLSMSVIVLTPTVLEVADALTGGRLPWQGTVRWVRIIVGPLLILSALWSLYRVFAPRMPDIPATHLPGALVTTIMWMILATGFSSFLSSFGRYNATYGSLAGVIITLIFLFLLCMSFVLGAEINAAIARRRASRTAHSASD